MYQLMTTIPHKNQQSIKITILFQRLDLERSEAITETSIAQTASPNCPIPRKCKAWKRFELGLFHLNWRSDKEIGSPDPAIFQACSDIQATFYCFTANLHCRFVRHNLQNFAECRTLWLWKAYDDAKHLSADKLINCLLATSCLGIIVCAEKLEIFELIQTNITCARAWNTTIKYLRLVTNFFTQIDISTTCLLHREPCIFWS